jgi:hypothetical protein
MIKEWKQESISCQQFYFKWKIKYIIKKSTIIHTPTHFFLRTKDKRECPKRNKTPKIEIPMAT